MSKKEYSDPSEELAAIIGKLGKLKAKTDKHMARITQIRDAEREAVRWYIAEVERVARAAGNPPPVLEDDEVLADYEHFIEGLEDALNNTQLASSALANTAENVQYAINCTV